MVRWSLFANGLLRFVSYFQGVQYFLRIDSTTQARYTECQNILDDFLIVDQSISRCKLQLTLFLNLCAEIGLNSQSPLRLRK